MQQDHEAAGHSVTFRPHSETGMNDAVWPFLNQSRTPALVMVLPALKSGPSQLTWSRKSLTCSEVCHKGDPEPIESSWQPPHPTVYPILRFTTVLSRDKHGAIERRGGSCPITAIVPSIWRTEVMSLPSQDSNFQVHVFIVCSVGHRT